MHVIDVTMFNDMDDLEWQTPAMLTLEDLATDDESTINTSMEVVNDNDDIDNISLASTDEDLQNMEAGWNDHNHTMPYVEIIHQPTNLMYEFDEEADEFIHPTPAAARAFLPMKPTKIQSTCNMRTL